MDILIYTIILLPLFGFIVNGLSGSKLPKKVVGAVATLVVFCSFLLAVSIFRGMKEDSAVIIIKAFEWFRIYNFSVDFSFQLDQLSIMMVMIITGIGTLIHLYSIGYMIHEKGFYKFFTYLNLFIFSMLLLVLGSNYLILFIGWEGVGLCSFLLIGFWYKNVEYGKAARKAFIMNRIGDLGLLLGIFAVAYHLNSLEYITIKENSRIFKIGSEVIIFITLSFFVGAMGKSAQIPLFTWLPDAMAGPTPVSALIHAATMVTAGIYLIVRSNFLYDLAPFTMDFILMIGLSTSLVAAFIALRQNDIKKVLAYSTVSQLGFMFIALGSGAYTTAMFHLMTHAFFKALMFLGSGSVIHAMGGEQDMRFMGGLRKKIQVTYYTFLIGTLAICGVPPFSGMISKDEILVTLYYKNPLLWVLALISAGMTVAYMFRLLFLTFFGHFRGTEEQRHHLHESPLSMTLPLIILAFFSVVGGFFNLPYFIGHGDYQYLAHWLQPVLINPIDHAEIAFIMEMVLLIVTIVMVLVIFLVVKYIYINKHKEALPDNDYKGWERLSARKLFIDEIYNKVIVDQVEGISRLISWFDRNVLDRFVNLFGKVAVNSGYSFKRIQNGNVETYVLIVSLAIALMLIVNFLV